MKKIYKNFLFVLAVLALLFTMVACGEEADTNTNGNQEVDTENNENETSSDSTFDEMTLTFGHHLDEDHILHRHVVKFQELLSEKTDGQITVEIYASGQLGEQRDLIDGLGVGTVDMTIVDTGVLSNFHRPLAILDAPYIFNDIQHAQRVLDGEVGDILKEEVTAETGIRVLSLQPTSFRSTALIGSAVDDPDTFSFEDFNGLSIRVLDSPAVIESFERFNSRAETIPTGEAYSSMEAGVVEGMESNPAFLDSIHVQEVADYLADTKHVLVNQAILMDDNNFNSLPEDVQQVIQEAVDESTEWFNSVTEEDDQSARDRLEENGVEIIELDLEPFIEAAYPFTEQFVEENGLEEIYQLIKDEE